MTTAERPCIFEESLAIQKVLAETIRYTDERDRQRAIGAITLTQRTLELHKEQRDCWSVCQGTTNCTMKEWVLTSRSAAAAAWKPDEFPAALDMGTAVTDKELPVEPVQRFTGFAKAQE